MKRVTFNLAEYFKHAFRKKYIFLSGISYRNLKQVYQTKETSLTKRKMFLGVGGDYDEIFYEWSRSFSNTDA